MVSLRAARLAWAGLIGAWLVGLDTWLGSRAAWRGSPAAGLGYSTGLFGRLGY